MFTLMFLASNHSAHADIRVVVARVVFLEDAVTFISETILPEKKGETSLVYCYCSCILLNKIRIFTG